MLLLNPIGWCDDTANMVIGCTPVSEGCKNCYASHDTPARVLRAGKWPGYPQPTETWGARGTRVPVESLVNRARFLNRRFICDKCRHTVPAIGNHNNSRTFKPGDTHPDCDGKIRRIRLFANSNSDWLDDRWPVETRAKLLQLIHECPNVDFLLLTKRPQDWKRHLRDVLGQMEDGLTDSDNLWNWIGRWTEGHFPANVWIGTSVENQAAAVTRIPELIQIPARVRFLSCEPLLGPVDIWGVIDRWENAGGEVNYTRDNPFFINWVIVGGESGKGARLCDTKWIHEICENCEASGVPVFVKQLGSNPFSSLCWSDPMESITHKKGGDMNEWPEHLRIRQFPNP